MHHGDGITSILCGAGLSITANAAGWIDVFGIAQHAMVTLLFGMLGGVGGWAAKRIIENVTERLKKRKVKN